MAALERLRFYTRSCSMNLWRRSAATLMNTALQMDWYMKIYLEGSDDNDPDIDTISEEEPAITCHIYELACDSDQSRELYCFTGMDGTTPTAEYLPALGGFLIFNYGRMQMEFFDCSDGSVTEMFPEIVHANSIPPAHFHPHEAHHGECYIMYPDICYLVDLEHPDSSGIIMKYSIKTELP